MKKRGLILAGASLVMLFAAAFVWMNWGIRNEVVKLKNFSRETGFAYTAEPHIPEGRMSLLGHSWKVRYKIQGGDSGSAPGHSSMRLFEDGRPLGPAHSLHDDVRNLGMGRFSHWGDVLYLSASDNSDPLVNGRLYTAQTRLVMKGGMKKALIVLVLFAVVVLMLSIYPVFAWLFKSFIVLLPFLGIALWLLGIVALLRWNHVQIGMSFSGILPHGLLILAMFLSFALTQFFVLKVSRKERAMTWPARIVGWGLCLIQLILVLEISCRIFPLPDTLAINPGVRYFWSDWVRHPLNNAGYREKDFEEKKPNDVYRIFVVGDSYVEGAGLRRDQTAGSFLECEINRRLTREGVKKRVEVYNLGHCGDNAVQEFARMKEMVPRFHPDLVVMTYVLNDAEEQGLSLVDLQTSRLRVFLNRYLTGVDGSYLWYRYLDLERTWISRMRPATRFTNYTEDIHRADAPGWIATQKAFGEMRAFFEQQDTDWFYVVWPLFSSGAVQESTKALHSKILTAMAQKGVEAYDLLSFFVSREPDLGKLAFSYRDSHPNSRAQELLGGFLADNILKRSSFKTFFEKSSALQK